MKKKKRKWEMDVWIGKSWESPFEVEDEMVTVGASKKGYDGEWYERDWPPRKVRVTVEEI